MKKVLLCSAAALGVALSAAPAAAQIDVTVGGHSKNYLGWSDQSGVRSVDMLRESELHINAEGTADNGLIYGFHTEIEVDSTDGAAGNDVEESYIYLASNMGRVNLGAEDGANYLLQVAAPSADSNIDGIRQYINPIRNAAGTGGAVLDYANDATGTAQKVTYLSPVWTGFQFGASYTPDAGDDEVTGLTGFNLDNAGLGEAYEGAARYEGVFNNVGFALGGGYTTIENDVPAGDDIDQWNVGADLDIGAFGLGAVYTETDNGADSETWVVGADYTTGPFQFGASYLSQDADAGSVSFNGDDVERYTGGVIYTAAPGLTFRGSVSYADLDTDTVVGTEDSVTTVLGGVQFNF